MRSKKKKSKEHCESEGVFRKKKGKATVKEKKRVLVVLCRGFLLNDCPGESQHSIEEHVFFTQLRNSRRDTREQKQEKDLSLY